MTTTRSDILKAAAVRCRPHLFANHASGGRFELWPHVKLIGNRIARALQRGNARLVFCLPVRHGKSELVARWTPTWFLDNHPDRRVILCSYEAGIATRWGRKVRNELKGNPFCRAYLADDSQAAHNWATDEDGGMICAGVGGPIGGHGGDLLVLSDPVKNWHEANSETVQRTLREWFDSTFTARAEPGASIIIETVRWHHNDLVGFLEREQPGVWTVVSLPAIAEPNDPLGRAPGEPLCPARFPLAELNAKRQTTALPIWNAVYQQRPDPPGSGVFKREWFRYYTDAGNHFILHHPDGDVKVSRETCWPFVVADTAESTRRSADPTCIGTWFCTPDRKLLLSRVQLERLEVPDVRSRLRDAYRGSGARFIGIEKKSSGTGVCQDFEREGIVVKPLTADTDKLTRSTTAQVLFENGRVYVNKDAGWRGAFEDELADFPHAPHDDQVDMTSYAALCIDAAAYCDVRIVSPIHDDSPRASTAEELWTTTWRR